MVVLLCILYYEKDAPTFYKIKKTAEFRIKNSDGKNIQDLEIPQRTQIPPSEELIAKLNQIASLPPFSYTQKKKDHDTL